MRPGLIAEAAMDAGAAQKHSEFLPLVEAVWDLKPKAVLEIGTMAGGTFKAWCECAADNALLVSVDLPNGRWGGGYTKEHGETLKGYAREKQTVELIRGDSHAPDIHAQAVALGPFDFLFIDGDHTYEGVKQDFEDYSTLVRPGGLIAFHDILPHPNVPECDVDRLWAELWDHYDTEEFTRPEETHPEWGQWGGIGLVRL